MERLNPTTTRTLTDDIASALENAYSGSLPASRKSALDKFKELGLPAARNEEYRFTPVTRYLEKKFKGDDFTKIADPDISSIDEYLIPGLDCYKVVFINGELSEELSALSGLRHSMTLGSLEAALDYPDSEAACYFSKLVKPGEDALSSLNAAGWSSGVFMRVPDNTVVDKPVFILHLHDAKKEKVISQTRVLMVIGKGSTVNVIEKSDTVGLNEVFDSCVEEITVLENATLNYHRIQNDQGEVFQNVTTCIHQHSSSHVNTLTLTLDGQLIRNNLHILVDGENCESHFYGLYLLHKNTLADNHTTVDHRKPNSYSNELYKGIMDGHSKGVFNGKIYVRPHAQKTNAFQSNRNILMSDTSTINTKPQLEIWADDVKCSHGCTSGQLDEEALFYLRSRGISKHTARAMVLDAFAGEVLQHIADPTLKGYISSLVSERLEKNL